jgi:hypothetical protein
MMRLKRIGRNQILSDLLLNLQYSILTATCKTQESVWSVGAASGLHYIGHCQRDRLEKRTL